MRIHIFIFFLFTSILPLSKGCYIEDSYAQTYKAQVYHMMK